MGGFFTRWIELVGQAPVVQTDTLRSHSKSRYFLRKTRKSTMSSLLRWMSLNISSSLEIQW